MGDARFVTKRETANMSDAESNKIVRLDNLVGTKVEAETSCGRCGFTYAVIREGKRRHKLEARCAHCDALFQVLNREDWVGIVRDLREQRRHSVHAGDGGGAAA